MPQVDAVFRTVRMRSLAERMRKARGTSQAGFLLRLVRSSRAEVGSARATRPRRSSPNPFRLLCLLAALWLLCSPRPAEAQAVENLLSGARPTASHGVASEERLTDGVAAVDGDTWKTPLSARFLGSTPT